MPAAQHHHTVMVLQVAVMASLPLDTPLSLLALAPEAVIIQKYAIFKVTVAKSPKAILGESP
jgi:hypothetical protein